MGSSNSTPTGITCLGESCPAAVEAVYDTDVLQKTAEDMAEHVELWFWNKKTKEEKTKDELTNLWFWNKKTKEEKAQDELTNLWFWNKKTKEEKAQDELTNLWFWNKKTKEEKAQDEMVKIDDSLVAFGKVTNLQKSAIPSVEDDGCCGKANPIVPADVAPIVMVFDILCPGLGTMIAAYYDPNGCNCATMTCAIFQMMLGVVLVGWIWSIIQGV